VRDLADRIEFLAPRSAKNLTPPLELEVMPTVAVPPARLSPSTLEAYASCPLSYRLLRSLRLKSFEEWDPENPSALRKGTWIHEALEHFFKAPDWMDTETKISSLLQAALTESFHERASPGYLKLLTASIPALSEKISEHVTLFERPLLGLNPSRRILVETSLSMPNFEGAFWHGKVDRIDLLNDAGDAILWDYKSGRVESPKRPLSQIASGKFQWFLYRRLLEAGGGEALSSVDSPHAIPPELNILGGGYLNPLDPARSSLFFFARNSAEAAKVQPIADLCIAAGHTNVTIFDPEDASALESALTSRLEGIRRGIDSGNFEASPLKDAICARCEAGALCGRPYLHVASSVNTEESAE